MKFKLRPWKISDLDNLVKYANNWNIAKNMTDQFPFPYSEKDGKAFIEMATKDDPVHIFAIDIDGQAVGGIGIHPQNDIHRKNAELGYWLAEPFWGQGIISNAIKLIVDFAFETYAISRVFARPYGTNIASQKVLEKNHFVLEGKFDQVLIKDNLLLDELVYAIRRENWKPLV
ncbi:MAG: GNAT family protein [Vicingaceae bacterium]|nr:GNAT family N-acetyltransferase [Flavobacteriales bacterium]MDF1675659.1 GNAT family protein [Vicingaceae bacterium]|tara:strand:+ start:1487 stop:2005 length:519 start_codon:yes stop_codon:yes gene_type:complete